MVAAMLAGPLHQMQPTATTAGKASAQAARAGAVALTAQDKGQQATSAQMAA
jgi:hypothetical protein